ncbi:MAG TPA: hypothetical protein ENM97_00455 [Moorella mulderi]|nr:hypothetical protein [Moorella mulderi]
MKRWARRLKVDVDLVLSSLSIAPLIMRESLPGLLLLGVGQALSTAEKMALQEPQVVSSPPDLASPFPEVNEYVERVTTSALALGSAYYLWTRHHRQALAVTSSVSPRPLFLGETALVSKALQEMKKKRGVLPAPPLLFRVGPGGGDGLVPRKSLQGSQACSGGDL